MRRSLPLLAVLALLPLPGVGQTNSSWIGQRVITHYGAVFKIGNQVVDDEKRDTNLAVSGHDRNSFRVYRVEHVNGGWLWLKAEKEGVEGWVQAEYVIPYSQAIDYFTTQIRANPNDHTWYICRGKGSSRNNRYISPSNLLGFQASAADWNAYFLPGPNVWSDKGEYDIAIADFNEAIRLDPSDEVAWLDRGHAWRLKKEYDKAIADYGEAIRLDPKDAMAYNGRAWLRATCPDEKYRDGQKAFADASQACQLDNYKGAHFLGTLAAAYAECGDFAKAVEWQEKANKMYTDDGDKKKGEERLKLYSDKKPYRNKG